VKKDKLDKATLLEFLSEVLQDFPNITEKQFNAIPNKCCTERTYRRIWGTFRKAKAEAFRLRPMVPPVVSDFSVTKETEKQVIANLKKEIKVLKKNKLTTEGIRKYIFKLKDTPTHVPDWLLKTQHTDESFHGVPTLLVSDLHYGEVVDSDQVFGVNKYNMDIADERLKILADNTTGILLKHLPSTYPGMVLCLAGDNVSGTIHEELLISNETPIMPVVVRVYGKLIWFIEQMKKIAGNVQVFCVHGNHGRTFRKPIYKDSALSSYDWLIYTLLDKHFENDKHVNFVIASGDDLQFQIYNVKYRLTHGGQFRGGQGFLGHIAPVTRGEIRKRTAAQSYGQDYDILLLGHFHSTGFFKKVFTNGSVIGYSEFSMNNNYPFERPQQSLWLTHPENDVTFFCPIFCSKKTKAKARPWVSWPKGGK
jgi:predicted phosphodiesterase